MKSLISATSPALEAVEIRSTATLELSPFSCYKDFMFFATSPFDYAFGALTDWLIAASRAALSDWADVYILL